MKGRTLREFSSSAEMSPGTLHNYLTDVSSPTMEKLIALINTSGVNLNWLVVGSGPEKLDEWGSEDPAAAYFAEKNKHINVKLLASIIECIEDVVGKLSIDVSVQKKCAITASIYDLYPDHADSAIDSDKILRLIQSTIGP